jgi:hypothetical protein
MRGGDEWVKRSHHDLLTKRKRKFKTNLLKVLGQNINNNNQTVIIIFSCSLDCEVMVVP